ncbi:hypothetical protein [Sphaerisporangium dianthi]|uniref:Uncharacterized protein n=1 Tax=Sphaerisporangium dianthi TaxID=1436120 RepID=A0ABV9CAP7_9ACTN
MALSSACGAGGNAAVCEEATKAFTDYSSKAAASAGSMETFNSATAELAAELKGLAGKTDGDLKTALTGMADSWAGFKIDTSDPAVATKMSEFTTKATEATQQLAAACS